MMLLTHSFNLLLNIYIFIFHFNLMIEGVQYMNIYVNIVRNLDFDLVRQFFI